MVFLDFSQFFPQIFTESALTSPYPQQNVPFPLPPTTKYSINDDIMWSQTK